jgi:F0F1-type ATP synthase assembly protein I
MLKMGAQVAVAIGLPLLAGAFAGSALDERFGTRPWGLLIGLLLALAIGTASLVAIIRRFLAQPLGPASDTARAAGRRWEREIVERERRREADEEVER